MAYLVGFGKHKDRTLEWVFFNDPGYIWWMRKHEADKNLRSATLQHFEKLVQRARHLAVPGTCLHCSAPITRMSVMEQPGQSGGLARVDFFCGKCHHDGSTHYWMTKPSFYTPDFFKSYDKLGGTILVNKIKWAFYGEKVRMTQDKMEAFFENPNYFVNP